MNDASKQKRRPVMLVVLDGWGWREEAADNAVRQARHADLRPAVGNRSARVPADRRPRGRAAARTDGQFRGRPPQHRRRPRGDAGPAAHRRRHRVAARSRQAPALTGLIDALKKSGGTCHLIGLVSPGGVHSHQDHGAALAKILTDAGVPTVAHAITDGRDTPPQSAGDDLKRFTAALPKSVPVATVLGRYYAMDRDKRWERVAKAYNAIVEAEGPRFPDRAGRHRRRLCQEAVRRVHRAGGDRRLSRHQGRRRRAVLQLPRRPRARNPRRHARSGFLRLPAQAHRSSSPPRSA